MKKAYDMMFKNIGKRGIAIAVICVLLFGGMAGVYAAFGEQIDEMLSGESTGETAVSVGNSNIDTQVQEVVREAEIKAEADKIEVDADLETKLSGTGNNRLESGYRRMLVEKQIPEKQRARLEKYILSCGDPEAALVLFSYLHDNFFTFGDLEDAAVRYANGEKLEDILQGYIDIEIKRQAKDYAVGEIDDFVKNKGLSIDDLRIAEMLESRGTAEFSAVTDMLSDGLSWEDIAGELDILNGTGVVQSCILNEADIIECAEALDISSDEAVKRLAVLCKAGVESDEAVEYVKSSTPVSRAVKDDAENKLSR